MPQQERPEEVAARQRVEAALGAALVFADVSGGVDYQFERDGRLAVLEVVRLTDGGLKRDKNAWANGNQMYQAPKLTKSWWVVTDGHPRYRGLAGRLQSALADLERQNVPEYVSDMAWSLRRDPHLRQAVAMLRADRVEQARPIKTKLPGAQIRKFARLAELERFAETDVEGARGYVQAELGFIVWTHKLYTCARSDAHE